MHLLWVVGVAAAAVTVAGAAVVIPHLRRRGVLDRPNHRTSHVEDTPRGVGVVFPLALVVGSVVALVVGIDQPGVLVTTAVMTIAASALGAADDLVSLPAKLRLTGQLVIGALGGVALAIQSSDSLAATVAIATVGSVAFAAIVNAVNFMDGINGISGGFACAAGAYVCVLGGVLDVDPLLAAGAALIGCAAGFLPFNVPSAIAFMGDSGSYFIGALTAACSLMIVLETGNPIVAGVPFGLYFVDTGVTIVRRHRRGEDLFSPHRAHAYQRLVASGWSHVASAGLATGVMVASSTVAAAFAIAGDGRAGLVRSGLIAIVVVVPAVGFVALADRTERTATG